MGGHVVLPAVVSIDPINDLRPDILVVPITTHAGPLRVRLPDNADVTGLREASHAKCESVGPLHIPVEVTHRKVANRRVAVD